MGRRWNQSRSFSKNHNHMSDSKHTVYSMLNRAITWHYTALLTTAFVSCLCCKNFLMHQQQLQPSLLHALQGVSQHHAEAYTRPPPTLLLFTVSFLQQAVPVVIVAAYHRNSASLLPYAYPLQTCAADQACCAIQCKILPKSLSMNDLTKVTLVRLRVPCMT